MPQAREGALGGFTEGVQDAAPRFSKPQTGPEKSISQSLRCSLRVAIVVFVVIIVIFLAVVFVFLFVFFLGRLSSKEDID